MYQGQHVCRVGRVVVPTPAEVVDICLSFTPFFREAVLIGPFVNQQVKSSLRFAGVRRVSERAQNDVKRNRFLVGGRPVYTDILDHVEHPSPLVPPDNDEVSRVAVGVGKSR